MNRSEQFEEMMRMSTSIISDAMSDLGLKHQTMDARIKPVSPEMKVGGMAATAECYPGGTHGTELVLENLRPGEVPVLDGKGYTDAVLWGEIFSLMAMTKGAEGAVVDGAVRDVPEVREMGFSLFAAAITPACGTGDELGRTGVPVSCGGVVVHPGDYVFGDVLGVVVVPGQRADDVHKQCGLVLEKEAKMIGDLKRRLDEEK